jgi:peptidoglycan/LPS O-acetylase OafA/YrhL
MAATLRQDDPRAPHYYRSLDGLRGLAALMVAFGHAGYFGWVRLVVGLATSGVILFFFLSGFLMAHHYLPDASLGVFNRGAVRYWLAFVLRRFVRVYPPFLFAPLVGYLLLRPRLPPDFERQLPIEGLSVFRELIRVTTFSGNLGIYWTIPVELFFYLLYPLIAGLCMLVGSRMMTLFLLWVSLMFFNHFPHGIAGMSWSIPLRSMWAGYLSMFVAGALAAVVSKELPPASRQRQAAWNAVSLASFAAFVLVVGLLSRLRPTQAFLWQLEWLFASLFFVMFLSLVRSDGVLDRLLSSPLAVALGRTSYSLYLVHIIAYYVVRSHMPAAVHGMPMAILVLSILCAGYYFLVERPFVQLSKRIRP